MMSIEPSVYSETGYRSFYFTEDLSPCATVSKKAKKKVDTFRKVIRKETNQKAKSI